GSVTAGFRNIRFERRYLFLQRGRSGSRVVRSFSTSFIFFSRNSAIPVDRVVGKGPNPQKRPDRVKSEKTDPSSGMYCILVRMVSLLGDVIWDVMNRNHPVGKRQDDKNQNEKCKPAEKVHAR